MKRLILFNFLILLLSGCEKTQVDPLPLMQNYNGSYIIDHKTYRESIFSLPPNYYNKSFSLEYNNSGRVMKRIWKVCLQQSTNCEFKETGTHDVITYNGKTIIVKTGSSNPEFPVLEVEHIFTVNNDNKIVSEVLNDLRFQVYDSIHYNYEAKGMIESSEKFRVYRSGIHENYVLKEEVRKFTFDTKGNLMQVETSSMYDDGVVHTIKKETFGNYDDAVNPFRNLFMFDDTFYRSLSKNNFRSYSSKTLNTYYNYETESSSREWVLNYNTDGTPIFDK